MADRPKNIPEPLLPAVEALLEYHQQQKFGEVTFELKAGAVVGKAKEHFFRKMSDPEAKAGS